MLRRKIDKDLFELYWFYTTQQKRLYNNSNGAASSQLQTLMAYSKKLAEVDHGSAWRNARLQ
uniref:Uncharacterized protein n=1 Tax=Plectus sambesii TaxID=2011161 RepID=A0A914WQT9_9BILA